MCLKIRPAKLPTAAFKLGFAHQKLGVNAPNETPLGTVIAAPKPEERELFCRNGLKWFARISPKKIRATLKEIERQRTALKLVWNAEHRLGAGGNQTARRDGARRSALDLDLAARMAAQSCQFMLWQQAVANHGRVGALRRPDATARRPYQKMAKQGIRELKKLERDFNANWSLRNKATPKHCSAFLRWRMEDYRNCLQA